MTTLERPLFLASLPSVGIVANHGPRARDVEVGETAQRRAVIPSAETYHVRVGCSGGDDFAFVAVVALLPNPALLLLLAPPKPPPPPPRFLGLVFFFFLPAKRAVDWVEGTNEDWH